MSPASCSMDVTDYIKTWLAGTEEEGDGRAHAPKLRSQAQVHKTQTRRQTLNFL